MDITVPVQDVTDKLYLREAICDATLEDGTEISFDVTIPNGSPYFQIGDRHYLISLTDILQALLALEKAYPAPQDLVDQGIIMVK